MFDSKQANPGVVRRGIAIVQSWVTERLTTIWGNHEERMRTNPAYRASVAAGLAGLVAELALGPIAAAAITAAAGAYASAHGPSERWSSRGYQLDAGWGDY
jgi:hypothetical protein